MNEQGLFPTNAVRHERLVRAVRAVVLEQPRPPLSPLATPRSWISDPGPLRLLVPGEEVGEDEHDDIAQAGWRVESYTQTFWDESQGRFWQALVRTTDGRTYYADLDVRR